MTDRFETTVASLNGPAIHAFPVTPDDAAALLARVWVLLVGWDNMVGIRYHFLHHVFPHIPDRRLPEVSRRLESSERLAESQMHEIELLTSRLRAADTDRAESSRVTDRLRALGFVPEPGLGHAVLDVG